MFVIYCAKAAYKIAQVQETI